MQGFKITWKAKKYETALNKELQSAVKRCANLVMADTKRLLSTEGQNAPTMAGLNTKPSGQRYAAGAKIIKDQTGKSVKAAYHGVYIKRHRGKHKGGVYGMERLYWNQAAQKWTTASKPPAPPHKQTGELRRSIGRQMEPGGLSAKVGPRDNLKYARPLELGTKRMEARPYLSVAYNMNLNKMEKLIAYAVAKAASTL